MPSKWQNRRRGPRGHVYGSDEAEYWSCRHPPGTPCQYRVDDRGPWRDGVVQGKAWTCTTGTVVVTIGAFPGVPITRVRVMEDAEI